MSRWGGHPRRLLLVLALAGTLGAPAAGAAPRTILLQGVGPFDEHAVRELAKQTPLAASSCIVYKIGGTATSPDLLRASALDLLQLLTGWLNKELKSAEPEACARGGPPYTEGAWVIDLINAQLAEVQLDAQKRPVGLSPVALKREHQAVAGSREDGAVGAGLLLDLLADQVLQGPSRVARCGASCQPYHHALARQIAAGPLGALDRLSEDVVKLPTREARTRVILEAAAAGQAGVARRSESACHGDWTLARTADSWALRCNAPPSGFGSLEVDLERFQQVGLSPWEVTPHCQSDLRYTRRNPLVLPLGPKWLVYYDRQVDPNQALQPGFVSGSRCRERARGEYVVDRPLSVEEFRRRKSLGESSQWLSMDPSELPAKLTISELSTYVGARRTRWVVTVRSLNNFFLECDTGSRCAENCQTGRRFEGEATISTMDCSGPDTMDLLPEDLTLRGPVKMPWPLLDPSFQRWDGKPTFSPRSSGNPVAARVLPDTTANGRNQETLEISLTGGGAEKAALVRSGRIDLSRYRTIEMDLCPLVTSDLEIALLFEIDDRTGYETRRQRLGAGNQHLIFPLDTPSMKSSLRGWDETYDQLMDRGRPVQRIWLLLYSWGRSISGVIRLRQPQLAPLGSDGGRGQEVGPVQAGIPVPR